MRKATVAFQTVALIGYCVCKGGIKGWIYDLLGYRGSKVWSCSLVCYGLVRFGAVVWYSLELWSGMLLGQ